MWEILEQVFISLDLPYRRQGSTVENEELPDEFYTFWQTNSNSDNYYDNTETSNIYEWSICYYTNNPTNLYSGLNNFIIKAKENGFIVDGLGFDIASGIDSYCGRIVKIKYIQKL